MHELCFNIFLFTLCYSIFIFVTQKLRLSAFSLKAAAKVACLRYEWLASEVSLGSRESGCHCVSDGLRYDAAHWLELTGSLSRHITCCT